jgi:hypothetical protein
MTDSPLSARSTPLRSNFADYISTSLRSDGRKPARQSKKLRARPQDSEGRETSSGQEISNSPRCFARARHRHYGARLRLSPRTPALARDATHGQDTRNNREIGHFRTASISQATLQRTETTELTVKTKSV